MGTPPAKFVNMEPTLYVRRYTHICTDIFCLDVLYTRWCLAIATTNCISLHVVKLITSSSSAHILTSCRLSMYSHH